MILLCRGKQVKLMRSFYGDYSTPACIKSDPNVSEFSFSVLLIPQKYEVEFLLHLVWMDKRLKHEIYDSMSGTAPPYIADVHEAIPMRYNPRRKPYLDALHHWGRVWVPDVYFVKHGDFRSNLDPVNVALRIFTNGTVYLTTRYVCMHSPHLPQLSG